MRKAKLKANATAQAPSQGASKCLSDAEIVQRVVAVMAGKSSMDTAEIAAIIGVPTRRVIDATISEELRQRRSAARQRRA